MRLMRKIHDAAREEDPICGTCGSSKMRLMKKFQDAAHNEVPICGL